MHIRTGLKKIDKIPKFNNEFVKNVIEKIGEF